MAPPRRGTPPPPKRPEGLFSSPAGRAYIHGRASPDNLVESIIGSPAASQHGVARPQHTEQRTGDGVGAAEALHSHLKGMSIDRQLER